MSIFDLDESLKTAERRLGAAPVRQRRRRSDAGRVRLPPRIVDEWRRLVSGRGRPSIRGLERELAAFCASRGLRPPSRATLYRLTATLPVHHYRAGDLPRPVRAALYNLDDDARVPGHQLVFCAFHHGDARAMAYASALPWVDLYQAARMRGWRATRRGPLRAAMKRRRIG